MLIDHDRKYGLDSDGKSLIITSPQGRLAQRQSIGLTHRGSQVQIPHRPPKIYAIHKKDSIAVNGTITASQNGLLKTESKGRQSEFCRAHHRINNLQTCENVTDSKIST
jgi:hypothetical protein